MPEPALRAAAVAGVLALALTVGGLAAGPAIAQPGDSDGTSQDSGDSSDSAGSDDGADASSGPAGNTENEDSEGDDEVTATDSESQEETLVGAVDDEGDPDELTDNAIGERRATDNALVPEFKDPNNPNKTFEFSHSLRIPVPRLPAAGEIPAGSWPTVSSFYTTVDIPLPTFQEFLTALAINPSPEPAPGPAFRTQEEEPVVDAASGRVGGAGGGGTMPETPVMRAPLVSVPRLTTLGGQGARPLEAAPAPAAAPAPGATQPGVAGARTPLIRGSLPPSAEASAQSMPAARGWLPPARPGYPRVLRNPTLAELALVALPGVAGLVLLTFGGGVIGYRQANSSRFVRTAGAERFLR